MNFEDVKKRGSKIDMHVMQVAPSRPHLQVGSLIVPEHQVEVKNQTEWTKSYKPSTSVEATAITNGNFVDVQLPTNSLHYIDNLFLYLRVTNATGGDVRLLPAPLLIDRIEVRSPQDELIQEIYGTALWLNLITLIPKPKWNGFSDNLNSNKRYGRGQIIPNGQSRKYYIPLIASFIDQIKPFMPAISGHFLFRIHFNRNSFEDGANITLNSCELRAIGHLIADVNEKINDFRQMDHSYRYCRYIQFQKSDTYNAATNYDHQLTSFNGLVSDIVFVMRAAPLTTARNNRRFWPILQFELLDEAGNVLTSQAIDDQFAREILAPKYFEGEAADYLAIYNYSFSENPQGALHGIQHGYYNFSGREILRISLQPAGAETAQVHTVIPVRGDTGAASAATSGVFAVAYKGQVTNNLAFDATAAQIQAAIRSLKSVNDEDLDVVVAGDGLDAVGGFTITISNFGAVLPSANGGLFTIVNSTLSNGTQRVEGVCTVTTAGVPLTQDQWASGAYQLTVYAKHYHEFRIMMNGMVSIASS